MVVYAAVEGGGTTWRVALAEGHPTNITESKVRKHLASCTALFLVSRSPHTASINPSDGERERQKGAECPLHEPRSLIIAPRRLVTYFNFFCW